MNAGLLKEVLQALGKTFENVKTRSMFGGYTIYVGEHVVAVLKGDSIFFKVPNPDNYPIELKYSYHKKERTIITNFIKLETSSIGDCEFISLIQQAIDVSIANNLIKQQGRTRLKDLPNLKYNIEKLLTEAGINDVDSLIRIGAEAAYQKLRARNPNLSTDVLLQLEGAVTGVHWMALSSKRKGILLSRFPRF
ncbi:TfoX/Sxy family DNA transformation protein [Vibrio mediterranei]